MRRGQPSFDKAPIPLRPRHAMPDPLFTLDRRITEAGLQIFLDALKRLGCSEAQMQSFSRLGQGTLSEAGMQIIRRKIDEAERRQVEAVAGEIVAKEMRTNLWGMF